MGTETQATCRRALTVALAPDPARGSMASIDTVRFSLCTAPTLFGFAPLAALAQLGMAKKTRCPRSDGSRAFGLWHRHCVTVRFAPIHLRRQLAQGMIVAEMLAQTSLPQQPVGQRMPPSSPSDVQRFAWMRPVLPQLPNPPLCQSPRAIGACRAPTKAVRPRL